MLSSHILSSSKLKRVRLIVCAVLKYHIIFSRLNISVQNVRFSSLISYVGLIVQMRLIRDSLMVVVHNQTIVDNHSKLSK